MSTGDPSRHASQEAELPDRGAVMAAMREAGLSADPSELHGSLCGYLCGGGRCDARDWIEQLALEIDRPPEAGDALDDLRAATTTQLSTDDFGFELLLPDEDAPLAERGDAMVAWCRGFLGGFGLAAPESAALSATAAEALQDIGNIAASDLSYEDSDADEDALAEIVEFVRVAALLLHGDCANHAQRKRRLH
jgi:uncharacterized protein YgfB (UPF0149 family)